MIRIQCTLPYSFSGMTIDIDKSDGATFNDSVYNNPILSSTVSNSYNFTITAQNGVVQSYILNITIGEPIPDFTPPLNSPYPIR